MASFDRSCWNSSVNTILRSSHIQFIRRICSEKVTVRKIINMHINLDDNSALKSSRSVVWLILSSINHACFPFHFMHSITPHQNTCMHALQQPTSSFTSYFPSVHFFSSSILSFTCPYILCRCTQWTATSGKCGLTIGSNLMLALQASLNSPWTGCFWTRFGNQTLISSTGKSPICIVSRCPTNSWDWDKMVSSLTPWGTHKKDSHQSSDINLNTQMSSHLFL